MKYTYKLNFLVFLAGLIAIGCEGTEVEETIDVHFVSFTQSEISILENSTEETSIVVNYAGPLLSNELIIDYSVEVVSGSDDDFSLSSTDGAFVIPAGQVSDTVKISTVDNFDSDGAKEIVLTITGTSENLSLGLPGPDANNKSVSIIINDDDCPFDIDMFTGTYSVNEDNGAFFYESTIAKVDDNTLSVSNIWGSGMTVDVKFDDSDLSDLRVYIEPQNTGVELCCGAPAWVTSRPDPDASASIPAQTGLPDGIFRTCDSSFEIDFYVYIPAQGTFNSGAPINAVYTKP